MKKQTRKLILSRETLRKLEIQPFDLPKVAGGNSNGGTTCYVAQTCGGDVTG